MTILTAPALLEYSSDNPSAYLVLEIDLPDGTTKRYCRANGGGIATPFGPATPKVLTWGSLKYARGSFRGDVPGVSGQSSVDDADNEWLKIVGYFGKAALWYSPTRVYMHSASPGMTGADSPLIFNGVLENWNKSQRRQYQLSYRVNDLWLKGAINRLPFRIDELPACAPDLLGTLMPQVWGEHSSVGTGKFGSVPLFEVDTLNHWYFVSHGPIHSVPKLYVNPTTGLLATSFTLSRKLINGKTMSIIEDIVPTPTVGDKLTADVLGIVDEDGDLIENPAAMLEAILANFGYGEGYRSGDITVAAGAAPLDQDFFALADTYFAMKHFKASRVFVERVGVDELITEFCLDFGMRAFWTEQGKLAVRPRTHLLTPGDRPWIRWDRDSLRSPSFPDAGSDGYLTRLLGKYCYQDTLADYVRTVEVQNRRVPESRQVADSLELRASHGALL